LPQFGRMFAHGEFRKTVVMEFEGLEVRWRVKGDVDEPGRAVRDLWLALPPHPNILEPIAASGEEFLLLRYAALDWNFAFDRARPTMAATWGLQLVEVYSLLLATVGQGDLFRFANPIVYIDIGGQARVGFLPADRACVAAIASNAGRRSPSLNEAALIHIVGTLLQQLTGGRNDAVSIIAGRCHDDDAEIAVQEPGAARAGAANGRCVAPDRPHG
jgi:hypothetical protein